MILFLVLTTTFYPLQRFHLVGEECLYRPDSRWPIYRQAEKCVGRLEAVAARCVVACEEEGALSHLGSAKLRTRERDLAMKINISFHI